MTEAQKLMVAVTIAGRPIAKGRPRFIEGCRGIHVYTPERTASWEAIMQAEMRRECPRPLEGPLRLEAWFIFRIPRSWPRWKREAAEDGEVPYLGKPDLDNLIKTVKDSGNGILWADDAQVVQLAAYKSYGAKDETCINLMKLN